MSFCCVVLGLFALERSLLKPLPPQAPDLDVWRCVTLPRDCHVKFDYKLSSAPFALVGKELWLRATDNCVTLFDDYRLVATHARGQRHGERLTSKEHLPPEAQLFFARDRQWLNAQALQIGPYCQQLLGVRSDL
jgi:hypothetical protein